MIKILKFLSSLTLFVEEKPKENGGRVKIIDEYYLGGTTYKIIEVDGVEYISAYNIGITPLIKETKKLNI